VGCGRIYEETQSGGKRDRPELQQCLKSVRAGDILVVWKLDRLGRSLQHMIDVMVDLEQRRVGFQSLTESIDTTSPTGKLVFHIFGSLAELERGLIRDRVKAGLDAARKNGKKFGRPGALSKRTKTWRWRCATARPPKLKLPGISM